MLKNGGLQRNERKRNLNVKKSGKIYKEGRGIEKLTVNRVLNKK